MSSECVAHSIHDLYSSCIIARDIWKSSYLISSEFAELSWSIPFSRPGSSPWCALKRFCPQRYEVNPLKDCFFCGCDFLGAELAWRCRQLVCFLKTRCTVWSWQDGMSIGRNKISRCGLQLSRYSSDRSWSSAFDASLKMWK